MADTRADVDLTPEEHAEAEKILTELRHHGYVGVEQHGTLRPGVRVRHRGEQWWEAIAEGTGVVLAITEKPDSPWSRSWGMPDVEMIVVADRAQFGSRLSQLAQYHVAVVDPDRFRV